MNMQRCLTMLLVAANLAAPQSRNADAALGAARHLEEAEGNYPAAIEAYKKFLAQYGANRVLAARALVRMGHCYEKLGDAEARKAYERVVSNYADQRETAAEARARLAGMVRPGRQVPSAMAIRQVWSGPEADATGSLSPDGRYLSYVHWDTGDLAVHDLVTGQNRLLTNKGTWQQSPEFADLNRISPDGKLVAYSWDDGKNRDEGQAGELRLIALNGSSPARTLYRNRDVGWLEPWAWSPDGKSILASFLRKDETNQLTLISVGDGTTRVIRTLDKGSPYRGRAAFSPDGRYIAYDYRGDVMLVRENGTGDTPLVNHPASDRLLAWAPDGKRILFASNRTGTQGIWIVGVADGKPQGAAELVKPDIGEVSPIGFTASGSFYYGLRHAVNDVYLAAVDLASGKVLSPPALVAQQGLGNNWGSDWSADGRRLIYRSGRTLSILTLDSGDTREIVPPLNVIGQPRWSPDAKSILVAGGKPDRRGLYTINPATGEPTLLIPVEIGTPIADIAWSPGGETVFFHAMRSVYARNIGTGAVRETCTSPAESVLRSFAVSPDGREVACVSARTLFIVPAAGGAPRELLRLKDVNDLFQFSGSLAWTPDGKQIVFSRYDRVDKCDLWRIPATGGEPRRLDIGMEHLREIRLHPDGRRIAFTAGPRTNDVWVMENFLK